MPLWGCVVPLTRDSALRLRLQRALADRNRTRIRDILVAYEALPCRSCSLGEEAVRIYSEPGWGVTLICDPGSAGCGGVRSILVD